MGSGKTRQKPARKGNSWPVIGYLVAYSVLALVILYGIGWAHHMLNHHPNFALSKLEIKGASPKTEADLRTKFADLMGRNFFDIDLGMIREEAQAHPWVAVADVYAHLPRQIEIQITEEMPAGLIRDGNQVLVVANDGHVIAPIAEMDQLAAKTADPTAFELLLDQPLLVGLPQDASRQEVVLRGLATLGQIREASLLFWEHMDTLDLSQPKNMVVQLRQERAPLYLGPKVIPANIKNYLAIAQYVQKEYPLLEYIELGFPNHIAIMPKEVK